MLKGQNINPLLSPQREKAGSQTFSKYSYQYHWALYRLISEHRNNREYAIFVEMHEDVVVANSLNKSDVKFEFNQVKTNEQPFTVHNLTKLKDGSSTLGKLLNSCINKCYSPQISEINLVSTSGFSIPVKTEGLDFERLNISDISIESVKEIEAKLKKEIRISEIPVILNFIIPEIDVKNHQTTVIGKISELIVNLFPSPTYDSVSIYRLLIDELYRKGMNHFDYQKWDESLEKKALTCSTVTKTINAFTNLKDEDKIHLEFNSIADEMGLRTIEKNILLQSLTRYKNQRIGTRTSLQLRTAQRMQKEIKENIPFCNSSITNLLTIVCSKLPKSVVSSFGSTEDLKGAVICEYIMEIYNEE